MPSILSVVALLIYLTVVSASAELVKKDENANTTCLSLFKSFPLQVAFPGTLEYAVTNGNFYDIRCTSSPSCIFYPSSAEDMSSALSLFERNNQQFAIKSGGHMPIPGSNNIAGGVLVATERMNTIEWLEDDSVVNVGAGVLWGDLYQAVGKKSKMVVGGRLPKIGVSGYLLGGGVSYYGAQYGLACDNVVGYEVVLANGTIVQANASAYSDLYKALKGGSSNFGLVSRFKLATYPTNGVWGGTILTTLGDTPLITTPRNRTLDAIVDFHLNGSDEKAAAILSLASQPSLDLNLLHGITFYSEPVTEPPAAFDSLRGLGGVQIFATQSLYELSVTAATGSINGVQRNTFRAGTLIATNESIRKVDEIFQSEFSKLDNVDGLLSTLTFQPISKSFVEAGTKNGGNVLGLDPSRAPYTWITQSSAWTNAADDEQILQAHKNVEEAYSSWAAENCLELDFRYMNDADGSQEIFPGYGTDNVEFLKTVKASYDPNDVFSELLPGGFKL